jgi:hypothetical protein
MTREELEGLKQLQLRRQNVHAEGRIEISMAARSRDGFDMYRIRVDRRRLIVA